MLSRQDIIYAYQYEGLEIYPFDKASVQPLSIDLHLAPVLCVYADDDTEETIDPYEPDDHKTLLLPFRHTIQIEPWQLYLGATIERIRLPATIGGIVAGKSSLARDGLEVEAAGVVDPGFSGTLTLELTWKRTRKNKTFTLYEGMPIAHMYFFHLETPADILYGDSRLGSKYNGQTKPTESRYWMNKRG
jgi:dCTP deaminase